MRARPRSGGDQELHIPIVGVELDFILVIILRQTQRNNACTGMREHEGLGVDGFGVTRQVKGRANLGFVAAALATGKEELAGEDFVDKGVLVGGGGGRTHGLEIGDGDGDEVAIEAEDNAA